MTYTETFKVNQHIRSKHIKFHKGLFTLYFSMYFAMSSPPTDFCKQKRRLVPAYPEQLLMYHVIANDYSRKPQKCDYTDSFPTGKDNDNLLLGQCVGKSVFHVIFTMCNLFLHSDMGIKLEIDATKLEQRYFIFHSLCVNTKQREFKINVI